jgi:hypothetical protein
MIVSPQGQTALVGKKDTEPLGVLPITNAASPAHPAVLSSNEMAVGLGSRPKMSERSSIGLYILLSSKCG